MINGEQFDYHGAALVQEAHLWSGLISTTHNRIRYS